MLRELLLTTKEYDPDGTQSDRDIVRIDLVKWFADRASVFWRVVDTGSSDSRSGSKDYSASSSPTYATRFEPATPVTGPALIDGILDDLVSDGAVGAGTKRDET